MPTPEEVRALIDAAEQSQRPEFARAILVAATTGLRRAELCGLRVRDLDLERGLLEVSSSVAVLKGRVVKEIPTKNRRVRTIAIDDLTSAIFQARVQMVRARADFARVDVVSDAFVLTDAPDGSEPRKPDAVSKFFARLRKRIGLDHLDFHYLRKFMETYGQEVGYSVAQVSMRAGHDPSIAAKHYSSRVSETDRALATVVASLLDPERS